MDSPARRLFETDLISAEFRIGVVKSYWGIADTGLLPEGFVWPKTILWLSPAARSNAPDRFYLCLDLDGYRNEPPTGMFWDPSTKATLEIAKRPKGRPDSRCAKVFRTDWDGAVAFYHPYDRHAAKSHAEWITAQPHLVWTNKHTIIDFLEEFRSLLHSGDYIGV